MSDREELLNQMVDNHCTSMAIEDDERMRGFIRGWFRCALTAAEDSDYVIMPRDQVLRKMTTEEFTEMMARLKFRDIDNG